MLTSLDSRELYLVVVAAVAVERGLELLLSRRNVRRALAAGGVEVGAGHYPWMVVLHASFLIAGPLEVWLLERPLVVPLATSMAVLLIAGMTLRYWAILSLGERWSTRVVCWPGRPVVRKGPYRLMRHPNYLAVVLEIVALPLLHGAWSVALLFSVLNFILLRHRIRVEETALSEYNDYRRRFGLRVDG